MTNKRLETVEVPAPRMGRAPSTRGLVLEMLFREPGISRAEIARATGLSRQTVGEIVADLERSDVVRRNGLQQGQIGRPATEHVVNPDAAFGIGVDLGGTNIRMALCDLSGRIRSQWRGETPRTDLDSLIDVIQQSAQALSREAGLDHADWKAMAIGIPGVVHSATGFVRLAENLQYLNGVQLGPVLEERLGVTVHVDNDVNCAAVGEWIGLDDEVQNFAFLSVGTGVGLALVLDGAVRSGSTGAAGEIGTMPFPGTGELLEDRIGARALEARLRACVPEFTSIHSVLGESADQWSPEVDAIIDSVVADIVDALQVVTAITDPAFIVLGGGIGSNDVVQQRIHERIAADGRDLPTVKSSVWGDQAGAVGCSVEALLMLRHQIIGPGASVGSARPVGAKVGS